MCTPVVYIYAICQRDGHAVDDIKVVFNFCTVHKQRLKTASESISNFNPLILFL